MHKNQYVFTRLFHLISQRALRLFRIETRPLMIANFALTSKCNIFCKSCNIGRDFVENPKIAANDLTLGEIEEFFARNQDFLHKADWIQLTGGEPFLREDIVQILQVIKKYLPNCKLWIPTNGTLPSRVINQAKECLNVGNLAGIGVSFHGLEEAHDKFTGMHGSYQRAMTTLQGLIDLKKTFSQTRLSVSYTLSRDNFKELVSLYKLSKKFDVDFTFRPTNYSELYYKNTLNTSDAKNPQQPDVEHEIDALIQEMHYRKKLYNPKISARLYFYKGIISFLRKPKRRHLPCQAGSTSFFLDAKGSVYPCLFVEKKMGNIREKSLAEIWNSPETKQIQKEIIDGHCPNCWVECETYRSIYENPFRVAAYLLKYLVNKNSIPD